MARKKSENITFNLTMPIKMVEELETVAMQMGLKRNPFILVAVRQYLDTKKATDSMDGMKDFFTGKMEQVFNEALKGGEKDVSSKRIN